MNHKGKGARAERRVMKLLKAEGYTCTRAGNSLGMFDVIVGAADVKV
jgi:Holliday junction resolvase